MNDRTARRSGEPPSRFIVTLLVLDLFVLVPIGLVVVWLGALAPLDYWDSFDRALMVVFGMALSLMFIVVGLGILRYNVLGRPPVRLQAGAVQIGSARFDWDEVRRVVPSHVHGVPYLTIELEPSAERRVAWLDRTVMRYSGPPDRPRGPLWITEQQLAERVEMALANVPSEKVDGD